MKRIWLVLVALGCDGVGLQPKYSARTSCAAEMRESKAAGDRFRAFSSSEDWLEDKRPALNDDGKPLYVKSTQNYIGGEFWDDFTGLYFSKDGSELIGYRDGQTQIRFRRATMGEQRKSKLLVESNDASAKLNACVAKTCKPLETQRQTAERLHSLHSSEATARQLVAAELALKECSDIWSDK